jgi:alpha-galactosidase
MVASAEAACDRLNAWGAYAPSDISGDNAAAVPTSDLSDIWKSHELFGSALLPGPGFAFSYGGHPAVAPEGVQHKSTGSSIETVFRYADGIQAIRTVKLLQDFSAVEYAIRFHNAGAGRSKAIDKVEALHASFSPQVLHDLYVLSSGGGTAEGTYPPNAFTIKKHLFAATVPTGGEVTLTTAGGRSSNLDLPFYFVHSEKLSSGIFIGVGWTGQWESTISANFDEVVTSHAGLSLRAGIPDLHIELEPGEEISGPTILMGSYRGAVADGSNRLRRLIQQHYTPQLDGNKMTVIATYDAWWNIQEDFDEALLKPIVDVAAEVGEEYFLLDAAWYIGSNGTEGFSGGVGNWDQVDARKFPSGLNHFADYVRSRGLKFGLWFEPERVRRGTILDKEHPDWTIWLNDNENYGLLDYGRVDVQEWVKEMMDRYIKQCGIKYIRHDFNIDPLPFWNSHDKPNRRGISQIRHIEGFYKVIDYIRDAHPATVLECCASGGRRIDLETARRFHTYWISDSTEDPAIDRFHLQGINCFLPGNYSYVQYTLPLSSQKDFTPRDIDYLSLFGGAFGVGGRLDLWPAAQKERFATLEKIHRRLRPFLMEDYYALLPQSMDLGGWDAWQFHNPRTNSGFVQAFRHDSAVASLNIPIFAVVSGDNYEFEDPVTGEKMQTPGAVAGKDGLLFQLDKMSSRILLYQPRTK